jgi:hypothetical protein
MLETDEHLHGYTPHPFLNDWMNRVREGDGAMEALAREGFDTGQPETNSDDSTA